MANGFWIRSSSQACGLVRRLREVMVRQNPDSVGIVEGHVSRTPWNQMYSYMVWVDPDDVQGPWHFWGNPDEDDLQNELECDQVGIVTELRPKQLRGMIEAVERGDNVAHE